MLKGGGNGLQCSYSNYQLNKSAELHKAEIDELKKAIDNNTVAVQQLIK